MSDRARPERPLADVLNTVFDRLSTALAGPEGRIHPNELLPGAGDPMEGTIPAEFLPDVETLDWFDPTEWAGLSEGEIPRMDISAIQPSVGGRDGKGLDFFRGSEAPSNYVNRNNPLYVSRRNFAVAIAPQIEDLFGVSAEGSAGYVRPPKASDAAPGGRSPNSDHQSGGAIDFVGDPQKLTALRNWLVDQPWVSFVRWQSESHETHLHVSFDLGWVAQNYFQGRQLPSVSAPSAPRQPAETPREPVQPRSAPTGVRVE